MYRYIRAVKFQAILALAVTLAACTAEQPDNRFTITGSAEGVPNQTIFLKTPAADGEESKVAYSAQIVDGQFAFSGELLHPPATMLLDFENPSYSSGTALIVHHGDYAISLSVSEQQVDGAGLQLVNTSSITGSAIYDQYAQLSADVRKNAGRDVNKRIAYLTTLARENPNDTLALLAVTELSYIRDYMSDNTREWYGLFDGMNEGLKASHMARTLRAGVTRRAGAMARNASAQQAATMPVAGEPFKDFTHNDENGNPVTASDLLQPQRYLLLDFWASWCLPCRVDNNPKLKILYNKYHDKGLDVLAVSLDEDMEDWLEAVEVDGMPWINVSEITDAAGVPKASKLYAVTSVPSSFLLDAEGTILAVNLEGDDLAEKIAELLGDSGH
ncbi:redoxin family protein [Porticoccus sp. GXU_MW_L64]